MIHVAVYDASVLYPSTTRDLLIRLGQAGLVQAHWTESILDEMFAALRRNRPDLDPARLARTRELMNAAVRDVLVVGYEPLIPVIDLPDPDDRHVVAAAVRCRADVVVTANLRHFPAAALRQWGLDAVAPDAFVHDLVEADASRVHEAVRRMAASWTRTPASSDEVLDRLERDGLSRSVAALRGE